MSKRSERREAERATRKLAYQQSREKQPAGAVLSAAESSMAHSSEPDLLARAQAFFSQPAETQPEEVAESAPVSLSRRAANQANAGKSTGPVTPTGKAVSSRNAIKHGLTGNTVLLDSDDADVYQARLDYYSDFYQPVGFEERRLVQAIHDANWRLDRITNLESTIYAKGRLELADQFEDTPEPQRKSFLELEISQRYAKDLRNLHIQESRIQRQRAKDLTALQQLQADRRAAQQEAEKLEQPANSRPLSKPVGFVFSNERNSVDTRALHVPVPLTDTPPSIR